ncbi:hypothetical protein G7Y89_g4973 [Cudoniella acicularis]|uniref:Pyruvate carboxyltransferase domain-containing protein n=1 Tax=Cudoniella acicularis TaxID=354080 RepID=A0A8H4RPQ4_9HELO|nr:hypothetical protein G7Y89_g4973 [Cudoniella acicularis]
MLEVRYKLGNSSIRRILSYAYLERRRRKRTGPAFLLPDAKVDKIIYYCSESWSHQILSQTRLHSSLEVGQQRRRLHGKEERELVRIVYNTSFTAATQRLYTRIPDTVGVAKPDHVTHVVSAVRAAVSVDIETHFHNDTGCAVANAYTAVMAGATHTDTTVLGIGERNGITPLGGFLACMIVYDREDILARYNVKALVALENLVASCCKITVPFNNCITGSAAFYHKAGIHTKAMLANPGTYEILRPEDFGVSRHIDSSSALSGWNSIMHRAQSLGLDINERDCKRATHVIKETADRGKLRTKDVDQILRRIVSEKC